MTLGDYLKVLDWTARQVRREKSKGGHTPAESPPILKRLGCDASMWLDLVQHFRQRFRNEAGLPSSRRSFRDGLRQARQSSSLSL